MQKTGCSHIASLLSSIFGGEQIGKHNAATSSQIESNRYFISSIRNPWDWYLSLWTYGVDGNGAIVDRLIRKRYLRPLGSVIKNPKKIHSRVFQEITKDVTLWRDVYDSSDKVESFRKWLKLIHNRDNSYFLGEGYENTAIIDLCGFMTYRYLYLCCRNVQCLNDAGLISSYNQLRQFENNNCYIDFFIRQESLEDDLCEAIEKVRPLTQEDKNLIYGARRTNTSRRTLSISDYYDNESIELVRDRDRLLVEKFDYSPPRLAEP